MNPGERKVRQAGKMGPPAFGASVTVGGYHFFHQALEDYVDTYVHVKWVGKTPETVDVYANGKLVCEAVLPTCWRSG